jgi:hypothetical protein
MAPMLIRLLGAFFPNTLEGTIEGTPNANVESAVAFIEVSRKLRLETDFLFVSLFISTNLLLF